MNKNTKQYLLIFLSIFFTIYSHQINGQYVAINKTSPPEATLDVNGAIKVGATIGEILGPRSGMILFTGEDFAGYTGTEWKSLTTPLEVPTITAAEKEVVVNLSYNNFTSPTNSIVHYNHTPTGRWILTGLRMISSLNIPVGSTIKEIKFYFYDNSPTLSARVGLQRYSMQSSTIPEEVIEERITFVASEAIVQHTLFTNHVVDSAHAYYLTFDNDNSPDIRIRSASIKYTVPVFD